MSVPTLVYLGSNGIMPPACNPTALLVLKKKGKLTILGKEEIGGKRVQKNYSSRDLVSNTLYSF